MAMRSPTNFKLSQPTSLSLYSYFTFSSPLSISLALC